MRALERPSADRITFALGLPGWNVETRCAIALSPRSGGTLLRPAETRALLEGAGLFDVREIERTWPAPIGLTAGRRP